MNEAQSSDKEASHQLTADWESLKIGLVLIDYDLDTTDKESAKLRDEVKLREYIHAEEHDAIMVGQSSYIIKIAPGVNTDHIRKVMSDFLAPKDTLFIVRIIPSASLIHNQGVIEWFSRLPQRNPMWR